MAGVPNLERLYECGDVLANAKGLTHKAHRAEYLEILLAVKGDDQCKRLSSQFIARFFPHFPDLCQQSIDAMLDLCEDGNVMIRMQAIKDMPNLCRDSQIKTLPKIADVLTQLLQSEDRAEICVIENSLMTLIRRDTKAAVIGIFSQVHTGEEIVRERALRLVHTKLKTNSGDLLNKEAQAQLVAEIKKVFSSASVTGEEFPRLMAILQMTYLPKSTAGQTEIATMVTTMANLDMAKDFDYSSPEATDRLLQCATHALPYFSKAVPSTAFAEYLISKVLPHYYLLSDIPGADTKTLLCKLTAELCLHLGPLAQPGEAARNVFDRLIDYMPLPPLAEDGSVTAEVPSLEFTKVECLMYAFHRICRQATTFLTEDEERLKDLKLRLQYLARGVTGYISKLREFLKTAGTRAKQAEAEDDVKVKQIALRTNENIQAMIRDLFHSPPIYKAEITLSFRERTKGAAGAPKPGEKRKPISFGGDSTGPKQGKVAAKGVAKQFGGMRMDQAAGTEGKKGFTAKPITSAYKPGGKAVRPSGQYKAPQGKWSSKVTGGKGADW